ncbi:MAG: chitobiase/beta-hexosaminidase C-terminal domain-containing protein [Opitutaceae bacterium]|nr:chitobiase/beta-hexosaminidase C-terminal domain-containing protein [Opitutaceae bacterium]
MTRDIFSRVGVFRAISRLAVAAGALLPALGWAQAPGGPYLEPPADIAAWWPGNGSPVELVRGSHDFELINGATYAAGKVSQGFAFDGIGSFARTPAHADFDIGASATGFTVEFWVKRDAVADGRVFQWFNASNQERVQGYFVDGGNNYRVYLPMTGDGGTGGYVTTNSGTITAGVWHHLAMTFEAATHIARLYVDGRLASPETVFGPGVPDTRAGGYLYLGSGSNDYRFKGVMDEFTLYNRPLSLAEIGALYDAGAAGKSPPDDNAPPVVDAGPDVALADTGSVATLNGTVSDDNKPFGPPAVLWTLVNGPDGGTVTFGDAAVAATTATFSAPGTYLLQLTASDGLTAPVSDLMEVRVGVVTVEPPADIAAWWPGNGHPREVIHGGHDLELINGAAYAAGKVSQGFAFDGAGSFARTPAHADFDIGASATGFTIEFWVKRDAVADGRVFQWYNASNQERVQGMFVDGGNNYRVHLPMTGDGGTGGYVTTNSGTITAGVWHHLAMTFEAATRIGRLYVDGRLASPETVFGSGVPDTRPSGYLYLGSGFNDFRFKGVLDEFTLYHRPLSLAEIGALYGAGAAGKSPPDDNTPPVVDAGPDVVLASTGAVATLNGTVSDDNKPFGPPAVQWSLVEGPGTATFADASAAATTATFSAPGTYLLQLTASDGLTAPVSDLMEVRVGVVTVEPSADIAAWWPGNGHPREVIRDGHDFELINGATYAAGKVSQGFVFNGTSSFARTPAHADFDIGASATGFTIEFWVKRDAVADGRVFQWYNASNQERVQGFFADGGNNYRVFLPMTGDGGTGGYVTTNSGTITAGVWHHLAMTFEAATRIARLYVDGRLASPETVFGTGVPDTRPSGYLYLGSGFNDYRFKGVVDEFTLYNRPLSLAEIGALYDVGAAGKSPPDDNAPPLVNAGPDIDIPDVTATATLYGTVTDDNKPFGPPAVQWSLVEGPGTATFADASAAATTATFSTLGTYLLQLVASDGLTAPVSDLMEVRVGVVTVEPPADIAAWWPGNGHPREVIRDGHDFELINGATYAAGKVSQGFVFNGTSSFARTPAHADFDIGASATGFTIEFWVKRDAVADGKVFQWYNAGNQERVQGMFVDYGNNYRVFLPMTGDGGTGGYVTTNSGTITAGAWHHLAVTFDAATRIGRLYVDGQPASSETTFSTGQPDTRAGGYLYLGSGFNDYRFKGVVDEFTLYRRPLAASEVLAVYQAGSAGKTLPSTNPGPELSDLKFNGAAVPAVIDRSGAFSVTAFDTYGVKRVEFSLDGQLLAADTTPEDGFTAPLVLKHVAVGAHTLAVQAWDMLDAPSDVLSAPITIAWPPPPAAPTALTVMALAPTQANLLWHGSLGTAGLTYEVERKAGASGTFAHLADVVSGLGYLDTTVEAGAPYTYRVRARDEVDQTGDYSNEASVTMPMGDRAGIPVASMRLWLRADAGLTVGPIPRWPDQSGHGQDAIQSVSASQPLLVTEVVQSRPVVRFDGTGDFLNLPDFMNGATAGELFAVLKARVVPSDRSREPWSFGGSFGAAYPSGNRLFDDFGSTTQWDLGVPAQDLSAYHVYNASSQPDEWIARLDGGLLFASITNQVAFRNNPMLGRTPQFANDYFFDGDIAEIMVFDRVLSDAERQAVEHYLFQRYDLALPTPLFAPEPGRYAGQVAVSLAAATPGAAIYYTTDESDPQPLVSPLFTAPVELTETTRVKAIACENERTSAVASALYSIGVPPGEAGPTSGFSAAYYQTADFGGTSVLRLDPLIDFPNAAAGRALVANTGSVRWTGVLTAQFSETCTFHVKSDGAPRLWIGDTLVIDGSGQTAYGELAGSIHLQAGQAYPLRLDYGVRDPAHSASDRITLSWSGLSIPRELVPTRQVASGLAYPGTVATPAAEPAGGTFSDHVAIALTSASPAGARIYYTLTGDEPTTAAALYTGPVTLQQSATLKARAYAAGCNDSGILVTSYTLDNAGPTLSNLTFNGAAVPATVAGSGTFRVTATDASGVKRVEFLLDGALLAADTIAADGFTAPFVIENVADGAHTLSVQAWDVYDAPSAVLTASFTVAYPPPPPPVITSPPDGWKINTAALAVRGTAQPNSQVTLYRGSDALGTVPAGADGAFALDITLLAGSNELTASARNRHPQPSALSAPVHVTYDNTVPAPPTALSARSRAEGRIALSWYAPASGLASGYYLFRSESSMPDNAVLSVSNALGGAMIRGQSYTDTPPADGRYYYRAVTAYAVGDSATLSVLSNEADAVSDRSLPAADVSLTALGPLYDAVGHRFGVGLVEATLTATETLGAAPFFNLTVAGGSPIFVDLTPQGENVYQGTFSIAASTSSGAVGPVFSAIDAAGNRGTTITLSTPAVIDTLGPKAIGLVPVRVTETGALEDLPELEVIKNDPVPPATAVSVAWRLTLDEAPKPGAAPVVTATLSGHSGDPLALTVADAGDSDARTWLVQLTLPADAGIETEDLTLHFTAADDLDNSGGDIVSPHVFQVYKGDLPPLAAPSGLTAEALPAGAIRLAWPAVPGAAAYSLQVKGPGQADFEDLLIVSGAATEHQYTPAEDGAYSYRIASVRTLNGQTTLSGWSPVATARSDRVPPDAPTNLVLQVVAQGLQASWAPPAARPEDVAGFALYRSASPIADVAGLTPAVAQIPSAATEAVDPRPEGGQPYYALVASDPAGNQSPPVAAFANVSLLPVRSLAVSRVDSEAPVLTWEPAPGSAIDGYNLLIEGVPVPVNGSLLIPTGTHTYADAAYPGGDRHYTVKTVSGPDSRARSLTLPSVELALDAAAEIKRGLMNTLLVTVRNHSAEAVADARLKVRVANRDHYAPDFISVAPGGEQTVSVVVGGYEDVSAGTTPVGLALVISPHEGEAVVLQRSTSARVTEGALTAEILPGEFLRGGTGPVRIKLTNPSTLPIEFKTARQNGAQPSDEVRLNIQDAQGTLLSTTPLRIVLGDNVVALPGGTTVVRVPASSTYTSSPISLALPLSAPSEVTVVLEMDAVYYDFGQPDTQVKLAGPRSQVQVSARDTSYSAEVTAITPADSNGADPIVISGRALWRGIDPAQPGAPAPNVAVTVHIALDGFIRQETILTDANGLFAYTFQPGAGEAGGVYQVWASHPDVTSPPDATATFTIHRVVVSPAAFSFQVPRNYRQALPVKVSAGPGTTVQNVRAVLVGDLPAAMSISTTPLPAVFPNQTLELPLSIVGLTATPDATAVGDLEFRVVSDAPGGGESTWGRVGVHYEFTDGRPVLQAAPAQIEIGVQPGQTASETLVLKNIGFAALEGATVSLVGENDTPAPDWARLQTPAALGTLEIGAQQSVIIAAAPPDTGQLVDQVYYLFLRVQGANLAAAQYVPVTVTVSPSGQGGVLLHVIDPYYQLTLPDGAQNPAFNGLAGVAVVLEKESSTGVPTATQGGATDANGEFLLNDLPAGRYKLRLTADRHEPYIGRITIKAGVVYSEQIQLAYTPVSFTWEVVPVTFQDRYEIILTTTYETNVPVPVVIVEPSSISLPKMCAGQVLNGEFRVANHGLIDANNFQIPVPAADEYFSCEILSGYSDTIKAGQSLRVAYRIKCLQPLPGECPATTAQAGSTSRFGGWAASSLAAAEPLRRRGAPMLFTAPGDGGSTVVDTPCGTYISGFHPRWTYQCVNGQVYTSETMVPFSAGYGKCGGTSSYGFKDESGFKYPSFHGPGPGIGGSPQRSPGVGGGDGSQDGCFPHPPACPPPRDKCDDECNQRLNPAGSEVDLITRQYRDSVDDLIVPVPGGSIAWWRDFNYRRWNFRLADRLQGVCSAATGACSLVLNGQSYLASQSLTSGGGSAVKPLSGVPAGDYLLKGAGPEKITKRADGTLVWSDGRGQERDYDAAGRPTAVRQGGRLLAQYHYDDQGRLAWITDRDDRTVLTLTFANGQVTQVVDYAGRAVSYAYDASGRLETVTDVAGAITTYSYDHWWHLTGKRVHLPGTPDTADAVETVEYYVYAVAAQPTPPADVVLPGDQLLGENIRGQVTKVSHAAGASRTYVYNYYEATRTYYARVTTAGGAEEESIFDASGTLISRSVNGEPVYKREYDAHTRVTTRGANARTTEELDERGNVTRRVLPDGAIERFEYDPSNRLIRVISPAPSSLLPAPITTYTYDALGNVLTKTEAVGTPLERVTTSEYYPGTTLLKQRTDPPALSGVEGAGRTTAYEYDPSDRLLQVTVLATGYSLPATTATYTYDALGRKETETDALGRVTTWHYDAQGRVTGQIDPLGGSTLSTYLGDRLVEVETGRTAAARGRIVRYEYDPAGRKTKEKRVAADGAEQVFKTFAYDADGHLVSEINALGQGVTYTYNAAGNQTMVSQPGADGTASATTTVYDVLDRPVEVYDPVGAKRTIQYDLRDRPVLVTEAAGTPIARTTSYRYDLLGRVTSETLLATGCSLLTTSYTYDALGRRTAVGGDRAYPVSRTYDAADRVASETDALGRIKSFDYDALDRVLAVRLNGATIAAYEYDPAGNRLTATDGAGNHRHYRYDALNRLTHESIPLAAAQSIPADWWTQPAFILRETAYNAWGEVVSTTTYTADPLPATGYSLLATTSAYDLFGRKISETETPVLSGVEGAGLTRTFEYDAADNLVKVVYPPVASSGETQPTAEVYVRSPHHAALVESLIDRAGNRTSYAYDEALRVVAETNTLGGVTHRGYDALGRVAGEADPAGGNTTFEYDLFDQPVKITYPDHAAGTHERIATFRYDSHGKLVEKAGAGDYPLTYGYDAVGNLASLTDGNGHATHWTYNAFNLVATKTYADNSTWSYTYDAAGRLATRVDGLGRTTTYGYNAYGLIASILYPTDAPVSFAYDQQGRRLSMTDGSGTTVWAYDAAGRLASENQGRSHRTLTYDYDSHGNRIGLGVASTVGGVSPWHTNYGYDNAGRLRSVLDDRLPSSQPYLYSYTPNANLVAQVNTPTGMTRTNTYDSLGRLLSTTGKRSDASVINTFTYTYDAAGQRSMEITPDYQQSFTYDAQRQVVQAMPVSLTPQRPAYQYAYDGIGNRTTGASNDGTGLASTIYTTNLVNQYTALNGALNDAPAYDVNGNTTSLQGMILRYDEENRLVEASDATQRVVYIYDGLGRRVERQEFANGTQTNLVRYVYDGWRVAEELDGSFAALRSYTRGLDLSGTLEGAGGIGGLLAMTQPAGSIFTAASYFYDGNGNVMDLIDDAGSSLAHYQYSPFGERLTATGPLVDINPYQFSSKERDPATGLYYYGYRWYSPSVGRWPSRDPIEEQGGVNLYGFVGNSPVCRIDRIGLDTETVADFIWHYFFGQGRPVDISNAGFMPRFKKRINKDIELLQERLKDIRPAFKCKGRGPIPISFEGVINSQFHISNMALTWDQALSDPIRILNNGGLDLEYTCKGSGYCKCDSNVYTPWKAVITCDLVFRIKDRFANPTDKVGPFYERDEKAYQTCVKACEGLPGAQRKQCLSECEKKHPPSELPGGTPYDITGSWNDSLGYEVNY